MKGILLAFIGESPFFENEVMVKCSDWWEFEAALYDQFDSDCSYLQIDCLDRDNHQYDAELRVGSNYYKCNNTVINQII